MDWIQLRHFLNHVSQFTGISKFRLFWNSVTNAIQYNISILEYFQFRFFDKVHNEKVSWAGTGFMYEYQLKMNPLSSRSILDDKRKFFREYRDFIIHQVADLERFDAEPLLARKLLDNKSGKIVFKGATGKCGAEVLVSKTTEFDEASLVKFLKEGPYDLVEQFIIQHPTLNELSPSAVNTIRIFTQLDNKGKVELLGCRLRISVSSAVDNLAAGNLAAPIDPQTGIVTGPGVYSDVAKRDEYVHPVTGKSIVGFEIPFWSEVLSLVTRAAISHPENRSIGWDVVVTDKGPGLIEGNHDWCKLLWQLPVKEGLKASLMRHLY